MNDNTERLKKEADFQNNRVKSMADGQTEARDRFYYLADQAKKHYEKLFDDVDGKSIVIVGCSQGGVTPLARKGAKVLGIDIADEPIAKLKAAIASEHLENTADARVMDAHQLDVDDRSLDIVCCTGVLHHLDVEMAARSWSKKLRSSGQVFMLEPMALNPAIAMYRLLTPSMRTEDEHPLLPKDIAILRKYFGRVEVHGYVLTSLLSMLWTFLPHSMSLKMRSLKLLEKIDNVLLRLIPPLVYLCWTSVIVLSAPLGIPSENVAEKSN